jgi:hypothetical protein
MTLEYSSLVDPIKRVVYIYHLLRSVAALAKPADEVVPVSSQPLSVVLHHNRLPPVHKSSTLDDDRQRVESEERSRYCIEA